MSFYTDVIQKDPRFHSTECIRDLELLEPGMRAAVAKFDAIAKTLGHELVVTETYRSPARQLELYQKKLTELKMVGVHGYGLAVDMMILVNGSKLDPNGDDYNFYATLGRQVGLISGRDWGHEHPHGWQDSDHLQRIPIFRQTSLFSGEWYPPENYDPYVDMKAHGVT